MSQVIINMKKKIVIIIAVLFAGVLGWRIYQYVPQHQKELLQSFENKQDVVKLYNSLGTDITDEFYEANEFNYLVKNWKSIYNYFQKNVRTIDRSKDTEWIIDEYHKNNESN